MTRGLPLWYAVLGGIAAWTVHLLFLTSWVEYSCTAHANWAMHVVTAVTAIATVIAIALAERLRRVGRAAPDDAPSASGRLHYLGIAGLAIGIINLALILVEGSYVLALSPCAR